MYERGQEHGARRAEVRTAQKRQSVDRKSCACLGQRRLLAARREGGGTPAASAEDALVSPSGDGWVVVLGVRGPRCPPRAEGLRCFAGSGRATPLLMGVQRGSGRGR